MPPNLSQNSDNDTDGTDAWNRSIETRATWFRQSVEAGRLPGTSFTLSTAITVVEPEIFYGSSNRLMIPAVSIPHGSCRDAAGITR